MVRLRVDFNSTMVDERGDKIPICKENSPREGQSDIKLVLPGTVAILHDGEVEVEATIEFDEKYRAWFGRPNWSTRRDT